MIGNAADGDLVLGTDHCRTIGTNITGLDNDRSTFPCCLGNNGRTKQTRIFSLEDLVGIIKLYIGFCSAVAVVITQYPISSSYDRRVHTGSSIALIHIHQVERRVHSAGMRPSIRYLRGLIPDIVVMTKVVAGQ